MGGSFIEDIKAQYAQNDKIHLNWFGKTSLSCVCARGRDIIIIIFEESDEMLFKNYIYIYYNLMKMWMCLKCVILKSHRFHSLSNSIKTFQMRINKSKFHNRRRINSVNLMSYWHFYASKLSQSVSQAVCRAQSVSPQFIFLNQSHLQKCIYATSRRRHKIRKFHNGRRMTTKKKEKLKKNRYIKWIIITIEFLCCRHDVTQTIAKTYQNHIATATTTIL